MSWVNWAMVGMLVVGIGIGMIIGLIIGGHSR